MKKILLSCFIVFSGAVWAQDAEQSVETIAEKILQKPAKESIDLTILDIAQEFMGKPYLAATLESVPERLVCNLSEFDCYTLVENVMALALTKHNTEPGFSTYLKYLQILRYRSGVISGYQDRMHYFSEWAHQAEENGFIQDVGKELGQEMVKTINFMSNNRQYYDALKSDNDMLDKISLAEKNLNAYKYYYVPKANFKAIENQIKDGDIIAFTSGIKGLDVNHEGFAIWRNGKLHLLHASSELKKVIISDETLWEYLNRIKKHNGVMIFRSS